MNLSRLQIVNSGLFKPGYLLKYGDYIRFVNEPKETVRVVGVCKDFLYTTSHKYSEVQFESADVDHDKSHLIKNLFWYQNVWGPHE